MGFHFNFYPVYKTKSATSLGICEDTDGPLLWWWCTSQAAAPRWLRTPWEGRGLWSSFRVEVYSEESRLFFLELERLEAFCKFVQNKAEGSGMQGTEQSAVLGHTPEFSQHG